MQHRHGPQNYCKVFSVVYRPEWQFGALAPITDWGSIFQSRLEYGPQIQIGAQAPITEWGSSLQPMLVNRPQMQFGAQAPK